MSQDGRRFGRHRRWCWLSALCMDLLAKVGRDSRTRNHSCMESIESIDLPFRCTSCLLRMHCTSLLPLNISSHSAT